MSKTIIQNRENYKNFLKGKKVVVVGPAPTIVGSKQHDLIESYDVVVRLNRALPIPEHLKKDIGSRTDVLYNCMNPSIECGGVIDTYLLDKLGVKFLVSPYAPIQNSKYRFKKDIDNYWIKNKNKIPFCHFDEKYFNELLKKIKLPNTGINAILDILTHDISELYITGFTFFKGGYMKEYRGYSEQQVLQRMARYNLHDQEKQLAYMRRILPKDTRVKMDKALSNVINPKNKVSFKISDKGKKINASKNTVKKTMAVGNGRRKIKPITYGKTQPKKKKK